jgi:predicted metal-dependent enzyme (double-stranded beta helix superfamily)
MSTTEELVAACREALAEPDPKGPIREILLGSVTDGRMADRLKYPSAGLNVLYRSADLTVLNVIWPPRMTLFPHDHRMWAAIGIYGGREDNSFYRREGDSLVACGGKELANGAVQLLGDDVIHAVHNPEHSSYTGAIHVYGGDFVGTLRSQWSTETLREQPYDLDSVHQEFERAELAFRSRG